MKLCILNLLFVSAVNCAPATLRSDNKKNRFDREEAKLKEQSKIKDVLNITDSIELKKLTNLLVDKDELIFELQTFLQALLQDANVERGVLKTHMAPLVEIRCAVTVREYLIDFVDDHYNPDDKDGATDKAELRDKLKLVKKKDLRHKTTEFLFAIKIKWILRKGKGYEVAELRKKLDDQNINYKKFAKSMGLGVVLLHKRVHALIPYSAIGQPIVFTVTDRMLVNKMIKVFMSLFELGKYCPDVNGNSL